MNEVKFYKKHDNGWPAKNLPPATHYYILWPSGIVQQMCWKTPDAWHLPNGLNTAKVAPGGECPWGTPIPGGVLADKFNLAVADGQPQNGVEPPEGPHGSAVDLLNHERAWSHPNCPTGDDLTGGIG